MDRKIKNSTLRLCTIIVIWIKTNVIVKLSKTIKELRRRISRYTKTILEKIIPTEVYNSNNRKNHIKYDMYVIFI